MICHKRNLDKPLSEYRPEPSTDPHGTTSRKTAEDALTLRRRHVLRSHIHALVLTRADANVPSPWMALRSTSLSGDRNLERVRLERMSRRDMTARRNPSSRTTGATASARVAVPSQCYCGYVGDNPPGETSTKRIPGHHCALFWRDMEDSLAATGGAVMNADARLHRVSGCSRLNALRRLGDSSPQNLEVCHPGPSQWGAACDPGLVAVPVLRGGMACIGTEDGRTPSVPEPTLYVPRGAVAPRPLPQSPVARDES